MNARSIRLVAALSAVFAVGAGTAFGQGQTWWVDVDGTAPGTGTIQDPYTSIHYAVGQPTTLDGDTILVLPGHYRETVEIVRKYVTVRSTEGPAETIIDALGNGTVVTVIGQLGDDEGGVVLDGFTICSGTGTWVDGLKTGGGILARDVDLGVYHCVIEANRATLGGGLASLVSFVDMLDCEVQDNCAETEMRARDGLGGGIYADTCGDVTTTEVRVRRNVAGMGGGIYVAHVNLSLTDSQILDNVAYGETFDGRAAQGGGVYGSDADVHIVGSRVEGNLAWGPYTKGGGLSFCGGGVARLESSEISRNVAGEWPFEPKKWEAWGGGIASCVDLTGVDLDVIGNHALGGGGGLYGTGVYSESRIFGNTARLGGGARVEDDEDCFGAVMTLTDCEIAENMAVVIGDLAGAGGGVSGPAFLQDSIVFGNTAWGNGGGTSGATLDKCEVYRNLVFNPFRDVPARGAGVFQGWVNESVLRDNSGLEFEDAVTYGGGAAQAVLTLTQVYDNRAQFGGGASNSFVDRVTVFANEAGCECGGLFFDTMGQVTSSIVWNNVTEEIVDLVGVTVEYSDIQFGWPGLGNHSVSPLFWNAGVRDFHLKPSSPCIDNGDPAVYDPDGSRCDVGALPYDDGYCGVPTTYCQASVNSLGCQADIGFAGSPSLTGSDDFVVNATQLRNQRNGLMFWGYTQGDKPFKGGTLCVNGPLNRTPVQNTGGTALPAGDCSGTLSFPFTQQFMNDNFLWHGRTIYAQFMYRDHGYFGDPKAIGTTDGLRVTICP